MKYGVFGGTFDPFTIAHYAVVQETISKKLVDKLIILPTIVDWYRKDKDTWLNDQFKIKAIKSAFRNNITTLGYTKINQSDIDNCKTDIIIDVSEYSWALLNPDFVQNRRYVNMLSDIICRYGEENEYFTIIGTDSYISLPKWSRYKAITSMSKLIVVDGRCGDILFGNLENDPNVYVTLSIDKKYSEVSASKIREKFKNKENGFEDYITNLRIMTNE